MPEDREPARLTVDIQKATAEEEEYFNIIEKMTERSSLHSARLSTTFHDPLQSGHKKPGHTVRKG
jgi:hypothetical protein